MRRMLYALATLVVLIGLAWVFGPREPADGPVTFSPADIGPDPDSYLAGREAAFEDIIPGVQKQIVWADPVAKTRTDIAIVYVHGFSATAQEVRPVPDRVAEALGANLYFTRLTGHGRDGPAMAEGTVPLWRNDMAEAMEIGRRLGDRVILMGTSTGGTLSTLAAFDERMNAGLAGLVQISPNYGLVAAGSELLTFPFARRIVRLVIGEERSFEPVNDGHGTYWTTRYPASAIVPMAASVKAAVNLPLESTGVPALFVYSEADQVVRADRTEKIARRWGGASTQMKVVVGAGDDPESHVIAGDILSPGQTAPVSDAIIAWIRAL